MPQLRPLLILKFHEHKSEGKRKINATKENLLQTSSRDRMPKKTRENIGREFIDETKSPMAEVRTKREVNSKSDGLGRLA